jgi:hypothetical protein
MSCVVKRALPNIAARSRAKHRVGCCGVRLSGDGQIMSKVEQIRSLPDRSGSGLFQLLSRGRFDPGWRTASAKDFDEAAGLFTFTTRSEEP